MLAIFQWGESVGWRKLMLKHKINSPSIRAPVVSSYIYSIPEFRQTFRLRNSFCCFI